MRMRRIILGWPHRDVRRHRFPVANGVWEYKLRPAEFVIFSYLCYHHAHGQGCALTPETVAADVRMATSTVKKYLNALSGKGLVTEANVPLLKCEAGKFFTLPNEVFLLNLPPSAFLVYAYLLLIENRQTHTCHPSYSTIAAATGLSKNTALKSVGVLLEKGFIATKASSYFDRHGMKWKGNNLYTILPVSAAVDLFHERQFRQLELDAERTLCRTKAALCATASAQATLAPSQAT